MLNLRIIDGHPFLCVRVPDATRLWDGQERGNPPEREEYEAYEEYPGVQRRALLVCRAQTRHPRRWMNPGRSAGVSHVIYA